MASSRVRKTLRHSIQLTAIIVLLLLALAPAGALAEGPNLIQNPGFERPFVAIIGKENCLVAAPWVAYWYDGSAEERSQGYLLAPEYKMGTTDAAPGDRVHSGELSQQWFHSFGNFEAGVLQQVSNVTPGAKLRFDLWMFAWSCDRESKGNCDKNTSGDPSPMHMRIGIDPTGATNPKGDTVVWSPDGKESYDKWSLYTVEATAKADHVTVFVYSYPTYRSQDNNVYIDDASLVVVAPPPTATAKPTDKPAPTATPKPTDVPTAAPTATAKPTDVPTAAPTATAKPTDKPAPTATPKPTNTPLPTATPTPVPALTKFAQTPGLYLPALGVVLLLGIGIGVVVSRRRR